MVKAKAIFYVMLVILFFYGCTTKFVNESGKQLPPGLGYAVQVVEQANILYDSLMSTAGKLHCDKQISDEVALKIVKAGRAYKLSVDTLRIAISQWKEVIENKGDTETYKYQTYLSLLSLIKEAPVLIDDFNKLTGRKAKIPAILTIDTLEEVFGGIYK